MDCHQHVETLLCGAASVVLKKEENEIDLEKSLVEQGGDMLSGVFFAGQCRELGLIVDIANASSMSLRDMALQLVESNPELLRPSTAMDCRSASVPHTLLQSLYRNFGASTGVTLDVDIPLTLEDVTKMLQRLVERHPILGSTAEPNDKTFYVFSNTVPSPILVSFESDKTHAEMRMLQEDSKSKVAVFSVMAFGEESRITNLSFVADNAAIDAQSWSILLHDIQAFPAGFNDLTTQSNTFPNWIESAFRGTDITVETAGTTKLPIHSEMSAEDSSPALSSCVFTLNPELTQAIQSEACHRTLRTEVQDLMFGALASTFGTQLPASVRYLEIKDGRPQDEGNAWNSVIGCFDEIFELAYECHGDIIDACRSAKDSRKQSSLSPVHYASCRYNLILDTTWLKACIGTSSTGKMRLMDNEPGRYAAEALVKSMGGLCMTPFWQGTGLSFLVVSSTDFGSDEDLKLNSEMFINHLQHISETLPNRSPWPTLSDFPHVSFDYPSLDRMFQQKLLQITQTPLADIHNIYPCTSIQENMLMGNSLDKDAYVCSFTARATTSGAFTHFDAAKWAEAWGRVVEKHSSLRTIFIKSEGRPGHFEQVILKSVAAPVDIMTGPSVPSKIEFQDFSVPHHLAIIQEGPGRCLMILTMSHAITDGHSAEVLLGDLCAEAVQTDGTGEEAFAYSEFALTEYQSTNTEVSDYWQDYLLKTQETILPVTREKSDFHDFNTVHSTMPVNVSSMDRICRRHNINLASVCQFAWGVVLRSRLGVDDVCFSYISSLRNKPLKGIMTAVGPLITTLLCSMNLEGESPVLDAIRAVDSEYVESLSHEKELYNITSPRRWCNTVMSFRRRLVQDDGGIPGLSYKLVKAFSPTNVSTHPPITQRYNNLILLIV